MSCKTTMRSIRYGIQNHTYNDLCQFSYTEACEMVKNMERLLYSTGVYGLNGEVFRSYEDGSLWAWYGTQHQFKYLH